MNKMLEIALTQYGIKEIRGEDDNAAIVAYFQEIGFEEIKDDETAWCAAFVIWCAMKTNYERTDDLLARSWLKVGKEIVNPQLGDLVIFQRGNSKWQGHVAFYISEDPNYIYCLGGNQGNMVTISAYAKNRVLGYRRLSKIKKIK